MIVYHLSVRGQLTTRLQWHGTLDDARQEGRKNASLMMSSEIRQYDIATDKNGILGLLNGRPEYRVYPGELTRSWAFTKRGGLVEITDMGTGDPPEADPVEITTESLKNVLQGMHRALDERSPQDIEDDKILAQLKPEPGPSAAEVQALADWRLRHPSPAEQRARAKKTPGEDS